MRQIDDAPLNQSLNHDQRDSLTPPSLVEPPAESATPPRFDTRGKLFGRFTLPQRLRFNPTTDEIERRSLLLKRMLIVLGVFLGFNLVMAFFLRNLNGNDALTMGIGLLTAGLSYTLNRLKRLLEAGYVFVYGIVILLFIYGWSGVLYFPSISLTYFGLTAAIVLAGLIISEIAPFLVATAGVLAFSFIFGRFANQPGNYGVLALSTWLYGAAFHYIMATMSWANARTINRSMRRQALQNQELFKANTQLEQNRQADLKIAVAVSQLSNDLTLISEDQSERAQSQAQSVAIVTSTLEELSATARQIAEVAEGVFTATEQALHTAEAGGESVGLSIDSIATLTQQVESISVIANELGNQSRRISEIVETITELAEETNLLALNATIEAAGAGEYGRRFQVVASEVQMLANRSRAASRDVQTILGQIRASINNTLLATNEGLSEARRMSEVAGQAGEAIEQIIETVESTTFLARQINLTTQQQRSATDQAVDMIRQVAGDSREAAARAQQLLTASDRLSETAVYLRHD